MKLKNIKILTTLIIICIFKTIIYAQDIEKPSQSKNIEYFPNSINTFWRYERHDKIKNEIDSITVKITGDTLIANRLLISGNTNQKRKKRFIIILLTTIL